MNSLDIKKFRKKLGLTQTEFGKALGVSLRAVQSWESGERNITQSTYLLIEELKKTQNAYFNKKHTQENTDNSLSNPNTPYNNEIISLLKDKIKSLEENKTLMEENKKLIEKNNALIEKDKTVQFKEISRLEDENKDLKEEIKEMQEELKHLRNELIEVLKNQNKSDTNSHKLK